MNSLNTFIVSYVSDCAKKNINAIESAKNELQEIDSKIKEADLLVLKRKKLLAVLEYCGEKTLGKNKDQISFDLESNTQQVSEAEDKILVLLKQSGPLTVRELVSSLGYDEDFIIVSAIKNLGVKQMITKDTDTLKFSLNEN